METSYRVVDNDSKYTEERHIEAPTALDDAVLLEQAKRRLAERKNIIWQGFDWALVLFSVCVLLALHWSEAEVYGVLLCFFWSVRFAVRLVHYAKPRLGGGVRRYLRERKARHLEMEYRRLKTMRGTDE